MNRQAVMRTQQSEKITPAPSGILQRACACGKHDSSSDGECEACKQKREGRLLRAAINPPPVPEVPSIVHEVLRSPGQPLDAEMRAFMEPRFGHDFSGVRVHTDARAAKSARAVNALAYTVGHDVVFGAGQYSKQSSAGRKLLAHELTHVIQQRDADSTLQEKPTVGDVDDNYEREAGSIAEAIATGNRQANSVYLTRQAGTSLQRACGPSAIGAPVGCTPVSGDIVGERFLFKVNCDEFLRPAEQTRLELFADTIANGERIEIHGYASLDGDPAFNENLSCARALKAQAIIQSITTGKGTSALVNVFMHGANPGSNPAEQRSVVVTRSGIAPVTPPTPSTGCVLPLNPDRSSRAFNPTTASENAVIANHPIDAFTVNGLAHDALALASSSGLPGLHLGPADSLRHCFWNCRMAQELGAAEAEEFATGHENSGPSSIPFDNQMDLHDNAIGRGLGAPGADCESECRSAVAAGLLRTIRGPEADTAASAEGLPPSSPPVSTTCIGASNQPWP